MAQIRYTHNSFSYGVLSKKILGNTDFEGYNNAMSECVNFIVQPTGGVFKRPGTVFQAYAMEDSRLILFSYDAENQYVCEFGTKQIRYYTKYGPLVDDKGQIVTTSYGKTTDPTTSEEVDLTFTAEQLSQMRTFQDGNILVILADNGFYALKRTKIDEFVFSPLSDLTQVPLTFMNTDQSKMVYCSRSTSTGSDSNKVYTFYFHQANNNENYIHPKTEPDKLFITEKDLDNRIMALTYKYQDTDNTGLLSFITFYFRVQKYELGLRDDKELIQGQLIDYLNSKKNQEIFLNNFVANEDHEDPQMQKPKVLTYKWQIEAFNLNVDRGWPRALAYYDSRLFLAGNEQFPTGIWGSSKLYNDWTDFTTSTNEADGVMFKMSSLHADKILWLAANSKLFAGTHWGVYIAGSANTTYAPISPSNFSMLQFTATGACDIQPVTALDSVFFIDVSKKAVHEISLNNESMSYQSECVSLLADDLMKSGIVAHTWQQNPIQIYWCATEEGHLCALTYLKQSGVMAWSKHVIGGKKAKIKQLCTLHGNKSDLVFMIVEREADGYLLNGTLTGGKRKRYIEYLHAPYDPLSDKEYEQFYVDSGKEFNYKFAVQNINSGQNTCVLISKEKITDNSTKEWFDTLAQYSAEKNESSIKPAYILSVTGTGPIQYRSKNNMPLFGVEVSSTNEQYTINLYRAYRKSPTEPHHFGLFIPINDSSLFEYWLFIQKSEIKITEVIRKDIIDNYATYEITAELTNSEHITDGDFVVISDFKRQLSSLGKILDISNYFTTLPTMEAELPIFTITKETDASKKFKLTSTTKLKNVDSQLISSRAYLYLFKKPDMQINILNYLYKNIIDRIPTVTLDKGRDSSKYFLLDNIAGMEELDNKRFRATNPIAQDSNSDTFPLIDQELTDQYVKEYDREKALTDINYQGVPIDCSTFTPFDSQQEDKGNAYQCFGTIEGLTHLAGQRVNVCINGNNAGLRTVKEDGSIILDDSKNPRIFSAVVGLPIESRMVTTPFAGGSLLGSSVGATGTQKNMWLYVFYSLGGKYGADDESLFPIPYQNFVTKLDISKTLATGLIKCPIVNARDIYNRSIYLTHNDPVAFNVLSITQDMYVSDT